MPTAATSPFADRLYDAVRSKNSRVCVGLDPVLGRLPPAVAREALDRHANTPLAVAMAFLEFGCGIIGAVAEYAAAFKPQAAFFEALGPPGMYALEALIGCAHEHGLLVIEDAKRGDIGSTAEAYAQGHLGLTPLIGGGEAPGFSPDALTVHPYLGRDGILPFINACTAHGKGIFVLVRTSNPSAGDLQDLEVDGEPVYLRVARLLAALGSGLTGRSGYSPVGAVVGATYPAQAEKVREILPHSWFLVPGYGAQGATARDTLANFDAQGFGAVVNSAREIIFAHQAAWARDRGLDYRAAAAAAARKMRDDLNSALAERGTPRG
ncbi:MAG: orotidine-5'-phosphate decarboxylase [Bacillota bacterium]|nr:orotidine-5'-phosphate decarboxylase [Bacillota bacterium]